MEDTTEKKETPVTTTPVAEVKPASVSPAPAFVDPRKRGKRGDSRGGSGRGGGDKKKWGGKKGGSERYKPEFDQKIINIRRVARVTTGGRRFSFSVSLVAGNRDGRVGVGIGKAGDTSLAIEKAFSNARKNLVTIPRTENKSIPHEAKAKYSSSRIFIMPAPGKGLVAGSSVRDVFALAGVTDISAKLLSRTKNQLNNARAAVKALSSLAPVRQKRAAAVVAETAEEKK